MPLVVRRLLRQLLPTWLWRAGRKRRCWNIIGLRGSNDWLGGRGRPQINLGKQRNNEHDRDDLDHDAEKKSSRIGSGHGRTPFCGWATADEEAPWKTLGQWESPLSNRNAGAQNIPLLFAKLLCRSTLRPACSRQLAAANLQNLLQA